jgi:hypothetical protein
MFLISYNPFEPDAKSSPYQGSGPIFVHSNECDPYSGSEIPDQQLGRLLSVRAYDNEHLMVDADVLQGDGLDEKAKEMLADGKVKYLHVHNAKRGCFAVQIVRE